MKVQTDIRNAIQLSGSGDAWGDYFGALVDVASVLYVRSEDVPSEWRFRAAPGLNEDGLRSDSFLAGEFLELLDDGTITASDLRDTGRVLDRYTSILRTQGRDY